jgi:hypothetical protein
MTLPATVGPPRLSLGCVPESVPAAFAGDVTAIATVDAPQIVDGEGTACDLCICVDMSGSTRSHAEQRSETRSSSASD